MHINIHIHNIHTYTYIWRKKQRVTSPSPPHTHRYDLGEKAIFSVLIETMCRRRNGSSSLLYMTLHYEIPLSIYSLTQSFSK